MLDFPLPVLDEADIQELLTSLWETTTTTTMTTEEEGHVTTTISQDSHSGSDQEETDNAGSSEQERKRRRMISNRESARRSRWRKKKHLEDLSEEMNRLAAQNREYKERLWSVTHQCHLVGRDNERLAYEYVALRAKFNDLYRILLSSSSSMQLQ